MTIKNICQQAQKSYPLVPLGDIELLLAEGLHRSLNYLYKNPEKILSRSSESTFWRLLERRRKNFSIAYLTRNKAFFGLDFYVSNHVLVPRPESELLVEEGLRYLKNKKNPNIIDVGTGSGCLIVALAKNYAAQPDGLVTTNPSGCFVAVDNSGRALKVAKTNLRKHGLKHRVKIIKSDLLKNVPVQKFDLVLANLPYLGRQHLKEPSIAKEPRQALVAGNDGLFCYQRFFKQLPKYLEKNGLALLEIDPQQDPEIKQIAIKHFPQAKIEIKKDLAGQARLLKIKDN